MKIIEMEESKFEKQKLPLYRFALCQQDRGNFDKAAVQVLAESGTMNINISVQSIRLIWSAIEKN